MRMIGKGHVRFLLGGACLSFLVLLSGVTYGTDGKEIKAHETPLKTRLEWTKNTSDEYHQVKWDSGFKAQYWESWRWHSDRYLFAVLTVLAPNVSWKGNPKTKKEIKKLIKSTYSPKGKVKIDFDGKFGCGSFNCVPFVDTGVPLRPCISFSNYDFVSNLPKSEGVLSRGASNSMTLYGVYCKNNSIGTPTEISEVVDSFYYKKP